MCTLNYEVWPTSTHPPVRQKTGLQRLGNQVLSPAGAFLAFPDRSLSLSPALPKIGAETCRYSFSTACVVCFLAARFSLPPRASRCRYVCTSLVLPTKNASLQVRMRVRASFLLAGVLASQIRSQLQLQWLKFRNDDITTRGGSHGSFMLGPTDLFLAVPSSRRTCRLPRLLVLCKAVLSRFSFTNLRLHDQLVVYMHSAYAQPHLHTMRHPPATSPTFNETDGCVRVRRYDTGIIRPKEL